MTVSELIEELKKFSPDDVVNLMAGYGWATLTEVCPSDDEGQVDLIG